VEVASWLAKNVELQDVLLGLAGAIAVVVVPALVAVAQFVLPIIAVFALVVAAAVALRAAWESNFLGIRDKAQAVWGWLKEFIPQAIQAIRDVVVAVTSAIREFWAEHGDAIMAKAQSVWEGIVGVFEWFKGQFMGVYDAFRSAFEGDWYAFGEKMRKVWNDAWLKIKEIGAEAIEAVQKFFTETDWGELGRGILDGIAKGITSGLDIIKTAAQDAASAALEAARGFLGIKSPAKKTIPVGVDFNQGIVVGLEETSAIERAAQDAGATALRGAETGMGGGTQNALHLYNPIFQGVQDAEGLFSEVAGMVVT
jgi:phage-related protein